MRLGHSPGAAPVPRPANSMAMKSAIFSNVFMAVTRR